MDLEGHLLAVLVHYMHLLEEEDTCVLWTCKWILLPMHRYYQSQRDMCVI